jgi:hypothetical protein
LLATKVTNTIKYPNIKAFWTTLPWITQATSHQIPLPCMSNVPDLESLEERVGILVLVVSKQSTFYRAVLFLQCCKKNDLFYHSICYPFRLLKNSSGCHHR